MARSAYLLVSTYFAFLFLNASLTNHSSLSAEDWPAFRGPNYDGMSTETNLPTEWGTGTNVKWTMAINGTGNSSPIVSAGKVFITKANDKGRERTLQCFDRTNGKRLWERTVTCDKDDPTHKTNPYAGSTPVSDGQRVVVWHGSAGLFCYDHSGKQLWAADLGHFKHIWGYAGSPVLYDGSIFLNCGPGENTFVASVSLKDGALNWKVEEPGGTLNQIPKVGYVGSWSTPVPMKVDGKTQIICSLPTRVAAFDPADGKIIWYCEGLANPPRGNLVYTSPIIGKEICVVLGGYQGPAIGFRPGGKGNITKTHRLWHNLKRNPQRIGSGVLVGDHIFTVNAGPGTVQCLVAKTGETKWQERLRGGNFWGSVIYADGHLYATNQEGITHVFKPNPQKLEVIASNELGEPSNSTPAFSDGEIFLRTAVSLHCIAEETR